MIVDLATLGAGGIRIQASLVIAAFALNPRRVFGVHVHGCSETKTGDARGACLAERASQKAASRQYNEGEEAILKKDISFGKRSVPPRSRALRISAARHPMQT